MHEFDVIVVDMCGVDNSIKMDDLPKDYSNPFRCYMKYPQNVFFTSLLTSKTILSREKPKNAIYIVFEGSYICGDHLTVNLSTQKSSEVKGCTYDFLNNIIEPNIEVHSKKGKRTTIVGDFEISRVLSKYNSSFQYLITVNHPEFYDKETKEMVKRDDFLPLVINDDQEIVSFVCIDEDNIVLVLPQSSRKSEIIVELLENYFPSILPELFPDSTQFCWLSNPEYSLPNTRFFEERKHLARDTYDEELKQIEKEIEENNKKYGFLQSLLKETDDMLVEATIMWLKWLGFQKIIDVDKEKGTKQEDIDIIEDDFIIIAEVKGIGGTSTDNECSQIAKHRRRIEKECHGKVVYPIYIVNHQRFMPPELRTNPPFTNNQIDYATHDERGLLTTYQLYIWFNAINEGVFTASEIQQALLTTGLIPMIPKTYFSIGRIETYYQKNKAFILKLSGTEIRVGDALVFVKQRIMIRANVLSIMIENEFVECVTNGEVGISIEPELSKGYDVYLAPK
jgi:hypothetical protein